MVLFRGSSSLNLDAKGRLAIPSKYRQVLKNQGDELLVVTRGVTADTCLWIYPLQKWEAVERLLDRLPNLNPGIQNLQRGLIGNTEECEMDGHGRILVPQSLRDYAKLEKRVVMVGQLNKFELWDADAWEEKNSGGLLSGDEGEDTGLAEILGSLSL